MVSRTNFELNCVVGLPNSRWRGEAFAIEPFQLPVGYIDKLEGINDDMPSNHSECKHPIHYALEWSEQLANTPGLTKTLISEREGVTRPALNHIIRLRRLPADVQKTLIGLSDPEEIAFHSERRLRKLVYLTAKEQRAGFAKLRQRWEAQAGR